MIKLVEFDCNCIGTPPDGTGFSHIIDNCDRGHDDDGSVTFFPRDMTGKNFRHLDTSDSEYVKPVLALGQLIVKAAKFDRLQAALKETIGWNGR